MLIDIAGKAVRTDDEGYLVDPSDWSEALGEELARTEGVPLTTDHWRVITFMRRYFEERQLAPDARFVVKYLEVDMGVGRAARNRLFQLFPYGYVQQACKIAGMRRPRAWSTG